MTEIKVVPLSVNKVWMGRRFKTPLYKSYEIVVINLLPKIENLVSPFRIELNFGFSSPLADIDNPIKPFLDILQKKYKINDKDIFELNIKKEIVKKGSEFIKFNITNIIL